MNKKISTPIAIGIITILVIIVGGFALWQRAEITKEENMPLPEIQIPEKKEIKDETAGLVPSEVEGWQTYRNEEYGFEVKYPEEWIVIKEEKNDYPIFYVLFGEKKESEINKELQAGEIRRAAWLSLYENKENLSLYDWTINKFGNPQEKDKGKLSEIKINNQNGFKYEFMSMGLETDILFSEDKKVINIGTVLDGCDDLETIFNQILSTFKFID